MCEYGAVVLFIHSTKQNLHIRYAPALCGLGPLPGLLTKHAHSSCGNEQPRRCCLHIPHTRPATNTRTQHASPTRRSHSTAYGDRLPLILSSLQLSHGLLSHPLSITTTIRTHAHAHRHKPPFLPQRDLSSLLALILSSALHSPCCSAKPPNKPPHCHYSLFSIVSMYTLLFLLSFVVVVQDERPLPPLTTSASPPSPPPPP